MIVNPAKIAAKAPGSLAASLSAIGQPTARKAFPIASRTHAALRAHEQKRRQGAAATRAFIKPENAAPIAEQMPTRSGDRLHAVVAGDFVFCSLLIAIAARWPGAALSVATLSMSLRNVEEIVAALNAGHLQRLDLLLSHYFSSTSRELFGAIDKHLAKRSDCRVAIARTHCKVSLFSWADARAPLVIESSANLRSSGNLEQLTAFADADLYAFHRSIFDECFALDFNR